MKGRKGTERKETEHKDTGAKAQGAKATGAQDSQEKGVEGDILVGERERDGQHAAR